MITSFFKTSKPSHYLIFLFLLISVFVFQRFDTYQIDALPVSYLKELFAFIVFFIELFVFVFVITKNDLTQNNSFAAFYLCLFILLLPKSLSNHSILLSNLFILLSFRRIFSLKTKTNIKRKLFDSGFWIALATIFYPLAALYFIPLFFSIFFLSSDFFKNIFTVFFGIISIGLLVSFHNIIFYNELKFLHRLLPQISLDFSAFNNVFLVLSAALLVTLAFWAMFSLFNIMMLKVSKTRFTFIMLFFAILVGILIPILSLTKTEAPFIFLLFPLAIIMANFTEYENSQWMSNLMIIVILGLALTKIGFNIQGLLHL
ncbi:MAG: DUF6427 family protein [Flavobacteriaceae bacterium]